MPLLHWFDREEDLTKAARAPYRLLEPVPSLHYGEEDSQNMLIEGDNLDGLKALLPYYAGQVKCVFIDPPYNTRSAFEHYDDNLEHAKWLSMIYPRIELLREFLSHDGSLWVTLDDNEAHYFKVICDELLGRQNFVANIVWQKTHTRENRTDISTVHDNLIVYAKNRATWKNIRNLLPASNSQVSRYTNPDNDPRGPWASLPAHAKAEKGRRQAQFFTITTPSGRPVNPPAGRCWLYTEDRFQDMVRDNRIWFGHEGRNVPRVKTFLSEVRAGLVPSSIWLHSDAGTNGQAKAEITNLFPGEPVFSTPKPEKLISTILHIATNPGELVLDSFLGSGTTAAVAHKMGRRWIGIEAREHARTHCAKRLRKVVDGEQGGVSVAVKWPEAGGGGFRFFKLGPPVFDDAGHIREGIKFEHLAAHVWFSETGTPRSTRATSNAFLGIHKETGYYLLFNGILGDRSPEGGNVLTKRLLIDLASHEGPKVIYGEACLLSDDRLRELNITFKQTPYDIKAR